MTLQLDWLRGCATALVTPFTASGAVDEKRLRDLIEYQIAGGVRILVPCGTTGESVTMSEDEKHHAYFYRESFNALLCALDNIAELQGQTDVPEVDQVKADDEQVID